MNVIPVRANLVIRGLNVINLFPHCHSHVENCSHVSWYCIHAKDVWKLTSLWQILTGFHNGSLVVTSECKMI